LVKQKISELQFYIPLPNTQYMGVLLYKKPNNNKMFQSFETLNAPAAKRVPANANVNTMNVYKTS